uniref:WHIM1 domain-containing protein n=1 Tax=Anopheles stephensi TaxID=30069 RepID=A0A182YLA9_ANOST
MFSTTFQLPKFDIEDLEEALLTDADAEGEVDLKVYSARLLPELIVALLKGCDALAQIGSHISSSNYQMFLRRLFRQKCQVRAHRSGSKIILIKHLFQSPKQEYNVDNPFNSDTDFEKLPLRTKILILKYLCDFRLDSEDVCTTFANYEADSLRLEPIGYDRNGSSYWHFFGTRLYREDYVSGGGKSKSAKSSVWQVICFTEEDWRNLANKLDQSGNAKERNLHDLLVENFLPYIPKLFRDKERERRNRLFERPRSTRIKLLQEGKNLRLQEQQQQQQQLQKQAEEQITRERQNLAEVVPAPERAQLLSEARAKRAERRPTTNSRGSTSPSVGSLWEASHEARHHALLLQHRTDDRTSSTPSRSSSGESPGLASGSEDSDGQCDISRRPAIYSDSYYIVRHREDSESVHSFSDIEAENNINSGNTDSTATGKQQQQLVAVEPSEPSATKALLRQQQPAVNKAVRKARQQRVVSGEVEKLLRANHNMAPTATSYPGAKRTTPSRPLPGPSYCRSAMHRRRARRRRRRRRQEKGRDQTRATTTSKWRECR